MELAHTVNIDGISCQFHQIPMLKKALLDAKVTNLLAPILGSFVGIDPEKELDPAFMGNLLAKLGESLTKMPEYEYEALIVELLSRVVAIIPGKGAVQLDAKNIDSALSGYGMLTFYKILMEVIKVNKFLPFDLGGLVSSIGSGTSQTAG